MSAATAGHDGRTYTEWPHHGVREFLAGRIDRMPTHEDFTRNFVADADGFVPVGQVQDWLTGEWVDVNTEIHADDVDWLVESWQRVFEIEWKVTTADERA